MTAIDPPQLRKQVDNLVQHYADPEKFLRDLRDLFNYYGDRTKRVSQHSAKTTALPASNVPQPVLRQIVVGLLPYAENVPHAILVLARSLWDVAHLEHRQLAAMLLGKLPLTYSDEILPMVPRWCNQNHEEALLVSLATHSLEQIRSGTPDVLIDQIESWLYPEPGDSEEDPPPEKRLTPAAMLNLKKLGCSALVPLVKSPDFENLPKIYRILKPLLRDAPSVLRPYLVDLLRPMARRSPQEITYILRTELTDSPSNKHLIWLSRRTLEELRPEHQSRLRKLIFPRQED